MLKLIIIATIWKELKLKGQSFNIFQGIKEMKSSIGPQAPKLLQSTLKIRHDGRQNLGGNHCWSISSSNTRMV